MMSITLNFQINRALRQVRNVFRDKNRWIRGQYHSHAGYPETERFCVRGALMQATRRGGGFHSDLFLIDPELDYLDARDVLESTAKRLHGESSMYVNDDIGYDAIMHVLDTAISDTQDGEQIHVQEPAQ